MTRDRSKWEYRCLKCGEVGLGPTHICSCLAHKLWMMTDRERRKWHWQQLQKRHVVKKLIK